MSNSKNTVTLKIGMLGDSEVGKTSLMVKYVEERFDEDYIQTLGVNFLEKVIRLRKNTQIKFSIWDLGGQDTFRKMLPLVCNEAVVIFFMFDLTREKSLRSIKNWYKQAKGLNKEFIPFLIGTKYDLFLQLSEDEQRNITKQARKYAKAMRSPLIFCSAKSSINVRKTFKVVIAKVFDMKTKIKPITKVGDPIFEGF